MTSYRLPKGTRSIFTTIRWSNKFRLEHFATDVAYAKFLAKKYKKEDK